MSKESAEPPRGEAAWRAAKKLVSDRNEAAYARGRQERAARNVKVASDRRTAEKQDRQNLPRPQGR